MSKEEEAMAEIEHKLEVLNKIGKRLNKAGITWAIGASLLLYFKEITDRFNDIDILVKEEDLLALKEIFMSMGTLKPQSRSKKYKTRSFLEFTVEGVDVDVMSGFVIVDDGIEYDCSLQENQIVEYLMIKGVEIPLQSVSLWRKYYERMHRYSSVDMIDKFNMKSK